MTKLNDTELMTRIAWLYYQAGLNQEATAKRLGLTRARVNKLLSRARETGVVSITINHRDVGQLPLEEKIRREFGLQFCIATPPLNITESDISSNKILAEFPLRAVGSAAASYLREFLAASPNAIIGTGWGRTLSQVSLHMAGVNAPDVKFVSLMGSLTANSAFNPYEVVQRFASTTGAEGYFLPVPFLANSASDRNVLLSQSSVSKPLALARDADMALISVGELEESALLRQQNLISADELKSLRQAGAVGDTIGMFFDKGGNAVDHALNDQTLAVAIDQLRKTNAVLLVAGREKLNAAHALLLGGIVKGLILDGDTAVDLLAVIESSA